MGGGAKSSSSHFDRRLCSHPFFYARYTARLAESADRVVLDRNANILKLRGIKLDPGPSENLPHHQAADKRADGETIRLGHLVEMIGNDQASSSWHVFDDKGGTTRDIVA